jgi:hypothetical protein
VATDQRRLVIKRNGARSVRALKVWFEGKRLKLRKTSNGRNWVTKVDLRGLTRGVYSVRVHAIVNNDHQYREMHYYRACYGNPKKGFADSLNAYKQIRLR